jgi:hypothetical protein
MRVLRRLSLVPFGSKQARLNGLLVAVRSQAAPGAASSAETRGQACAQVAPTDVLAAQRAGVRHAASSSTANV